MRLTAHTLVFVVSVFFCFDHSTAYRENAFLWNAPVELYDWCPGYDPKTAPFSQQLFCENLDLVQKAYETSFIQGIKSGVLHPTAYARYDLQDWVYLDEVGKIYGAVCDKPGKECDATWRAFFTEAAADYARYADAYPGSYYVNEDFEQVVDVQAATTAYVQFEQKASDENAAEYTAVVMAPCMQLWGPLAQRLYKEDAATSTSAYSFWIYDNKDYVPTELNERLDSFKYKRDIAMDIYREGLEHEIDLFNIARPPTQMLNRKMHLKAGFVEA